METSPEFSNFYAVNSHFPDALPPPVVMKRSNASGNLQGLFEAGRYISYATPENARMRGAVPLPGKEVAKYNVAPPLPTDEELYKRGVQAWQYSGDWSPQQASAIAMNAHFSNDWARPERQVAEAGCSCKNKKK